MHQLMLLAISFVTGSAARRAQHVGDLGHLRRRGLMFTAWYGVWIVLWMFVGMPLFGVPGHAHLLAIIALSIPSLLAVAALGMSIGLILRGGQSVLQIMAFSSYPFFFVSGMSWPRDAFTPWLDRLGNLVPLRPLAAGIGRSFRMDASLTDIRPEIIHAWCLALGYGAILIVVYQFSKRRFRGL